MANFKQILTICLDDASYTQIAHTLGWGLTLDVAIFRGVRPSLVSRLNNGYRIRMGDFEMRKATSPKEPDE